MNSGRNLEVVGGTNLDICVEGKLEVSQREVAMSHGEK